MSGGGLPIPNILREFGHTTIYHVTPLHFLPAIASDRSLWSKNTLINLGYSTRHFRTTSFQTDIRRGFSDVVHCMTCSRPPLLASKLRKGYPHIVLEIDTESLRESDYALCRYNIARNRGQWTESEQHGRIRRPYQIPVATTESEKRGLLGNCGRSCIEVLTQSGFRLQTATTVQTFHPMDRKLVAEILEHFELPWRAKLARSDGEYRWDSEYRATMQDYITKAMLDASWRPTAEEELEFDR